MNKRAGKPAPAAGKSGGVTEAIKRFVPKFTGESAGAPKPRREPKVAKPQTNRPPKLQELTPELREQIAQAYQQEITVGGITPQEAITRISDKLWITRKAVSHVLNKILNPEVPITPELKTRIIEMYSGYVARGERPEGGRRNNIVKAVGVPFRQVRDIVYAWAQSQYAKSPTADLSREQRFEVEKLYWDELDKERYSLAEIPVKIAEQLGYTTAFQVSRWLDTLNDDETKFARVPDVLPEIERQILGAYQQYLAAPKPPEHGLHYIIAAQVGGVSQRHVHKVLQQYRTRRRAEYPLK